MLIYKSVKLYEQKLILKERSLLLISDINDFSWTDNKGQTEFNILISILLSYQCLILLIDESQHENSLSNTAVINDHAISNERCFITHYLCYFGNLSGFKLKRGAFNAFIINDIRNQLLWIKTELLVCCLIVEGLSWDLADFLLKISEGLFAAAEVSNDCLRRICLCWV